MWNYQKAMTLALSLIYAPVPPPKDEGLGIYSWIILGVIAGIVAAFLIYKLAGKPSRKND
jgi:hypothetical protein